MRPGLTSPPSHVCPLRLSVRKAAADGAQVRQVWPWACALPDFWARDGDTQLDRHFTQMHSP